LSVATIRKGKLGKPKECRNYCA